MPRGSPDKRRRTCLRRIRPETGSGKVSTALLPAAETGLSVDSKAQAEQIRSVDVTRVGDRVGALTPELVAALDEAIRLHLGL